MVLVHLGFLLLVLIVTQTNPIQLESSSMKSGSFLLSPSNLPVTIQVEGRTTGGQDLSFETQLPSSSSDISLPVSVREFGSTNINTQADLNKAIGDKIRALESQFSTLPNSQVNGSSINTTVSQQNQVIQDQNALIEGLRVEVEQLRSQVDEMSRTV